MQTKYGDIKIINDLFLVVKTYIDKAEHYSEIDIKHTVYKCKLCGDKIDTVFGYREKIKSHLELHKIIKELNL